MLRLKDRYADTDHFCNKLLVTDLQDLPYRNGATIHNLYLDIETTSKDDKLDSKNPWHHCHLMGIGITVDGDTNAYYIPVDHRDDSYNLPKSVVLKWLQNILDRTEQWVNHNLKYDLHVLANEGLNIPSDLKLYDTLTVSKLYNSDLLSHSLDSIALKYCKLDIKPYERDLKSQLQVDGKWKYYDYGRVTFPTIAIYGVMDVVANRELHKFFTKECDNPLQIIELPLTSRLYEIERRGISVTRQKVMQTGLHSVERMLEIGTEIEKISGAAFGFGSRDAALDLLVNHYGLPILKYTNEDDRGEDIVSNPSFNKEAMVEYAAHPKVLHNPELRKVVDLLVEFKKLKTFESLFIRPFLNLEVEGKLYPFYNQMVRTGRMSCGKPNIQQQSKLSKFLIETDPDHYLVSFDLSQIEFRLIAHYLNNEQVVKAYQENPKADYHQLIADMCEIDRKPAKNINFAMGFGAGKKKTLQMLKISLPNVEDYTPTALDLHAQSVYNSYHRMLPELKPMSSEAANTVRRQGFVRNLYGGRRTLDRQRAHIAFNTVIQSSAACIMKDITLSLCELTSGCGDCQLHAIIHDDWLFKIDKGRMSYWVPKIMETIENVNPPTQLRVPVRTSCEYSETNWGEMREWQTN